MIGALGRIAVVAGVLCGATTCSAAGAQSRASSIAKTSPHAVRFVSWNIGANSVVPRYGVVFDTLALSRPAAFARVMRALHADVICLQELSAGPARARALLDVIDPLPDGRHWHAFSALGNVLLSRFDLVQPTSRKFRQWVSHRAHIVARVQLPDSVSAFDPVVACAHFQAKSGRANVALRQRQADTIVADLLRRRAASVQLHVPVVVLGDLNVVDEPARYIESLLMLPLEDATPRHNAFRNATHDAFYDSFHDGSEHASRMNDYTWRDDRQRFPPGRLDRVLYDDAAFELAQSFVLNTLTLDPAELRAFGLRASDTLRDATVGWYDHLPLVVDLTARDRRLPHDSSGAPRPAR